MMLMPTWLFALIVGVAVAFAAISALVALPFALWRGDGGEWARQAVGLVPYAVIAIGCVWLRSYLP